MTEREHTTTDPAVAGLLAEASRSWNAGDLEHALRQYRAIVHDHPRHAGALHDLGCLYGQIGRTQEAAEMLRRAIEVDDRRAESHVFLANVLILAGRPAEAAESMGRAIALDPDDAWTQASGAACLARCNRLDDARAAAARALALEPGHALASVIIAGLDLRGGKPDDAIERLELMLAAGAFTGELHRRALYHLGRAQEQRGDCDRAFETFDRMGRAAAEEAAAAGLDRTVWPRLIDAYRQALVPELFAGLSAPGPAAPRSPAFLVGFPRSGTTMTEQILAAHPDVVTTDERPTITQVRQRLAGLGGDPATVARRLTPAQLDEVRTFYFAQTEAALGEPIGERRLVDKLPLNIVDLALINVIFPVAPVIVALRDPRDACLSCFMQDFGLNAAMIHFNTLPGTAAFYALVMDLWRRQREVITLPWIEVRYEDTVRDLAAQARRLTDHLGLPWDAAVLDFHERAGERVISTPSFEAVTERVHTRAIGRWRRYESRFDAVQEVLAPFVDAFGYGTQELSHDMDRYQQALNAARARQFSTAETLCQQIIAKDRKHAGALALLAQFRQIATDHAEAIRFLDRAVKIEPRSRELRMRLAENHAAIGQYDQALVQVNHALKLAPGDTEAMVVKAMALEHKGSYDKAIALLKPQVAAPAPEPGLVAVYVRILTRQGDLDEAIELGRRVLAADLEPNMWVRDAWFALAKAHEVAGDYVGAMEAVGRGNAILAEPFDPAAHRRKVDELITVFFGEMLAAVPRPATPSHKPVFIVGMPRTGSTLVERILHAHPKIFGAGEMVELPRVVGGLQLAMGSIAPYPECVRALTAADVETASGKYLAALTAAAPKMGVERIVDKQLGNFIHVGMIDILFPGARVIHCRRDAVDTCLSCYFERLQPWILPYASRLDHLGAYYRQYERLMAHWRESVSVPLLEVSYEELIDDQEQVSRRLIDFLGLEWNDACLRFHEVRRHESTLSYDQVRKPLYRASIGRAERLGTLLDPLREALAGS